MSTNRETNLVDYPTVEEGMHVYAAQAQAIADVMTALTGMNGRLEHGWQNDTSRAFIDVYKEIHEKNLIAVRDELEKISRDLSTYLQIRKEEDSAGARSLYNH